MTESFDANTIVNVTKELRVNGRIPHFWDSPSDLGREVAQTLITVHRTDVLLPHIPNKWCKLDCQLLVYKDKDWVRNGQTVDCSLVLTGRSVSKTCRFIYRLTEWY